MVERAVRDFDDDERVGRAAMGGGIGVETRPQGHEIRLKLVIGVETQLILDADGDKAVGDRAGEPLLRRRFIPPAGGKTVRGSRGRTLRYRNFPLRRPKAKPPLAQVPKFNQYWLYNRKVAKTGTNSR